MVGATRLGIGIALLTTTLTAPASAAQCTHRITGDGYPVWSRNCDLTLKPGVLGPLRMGKTSVQEAKKLGYLARNPMCNRTDGISAGGNWNRKAGKVVAWQLRVPTSKGLRVGDTLSRARTLYPSATRTGFVKNPYTAGGWNIYSIKGSRGWLDVYVRSGSKKVDLFYTRAKSLPKPVLAWAFDGC